MDFDVYLDIDGVLLANDRQAAIGVHEFLEYVLERHPTYWLTTHCKGDAKCTLRVLSEVLEPSTLELAKRVRPTNWNTAKTEAINFSRPFLWFDDDLFEQERVDLMLRGVMENWIGVDLSRNSNQLQRFIESFPVPINFLHWINIDQVYYAVRDGFVLEKDGIHGVGHWMRVMDNGLKLARKTGANKDVVRLFALLHDAKREDEGPDTGHGKRAADFAASLQGKLINLPKQEFELLYEACAGHSDGRTNADVTVQTCWDADRLDLKRLGFVLNSDRLCTQAAKDLIR